MRKLLVLLALGFGLLGHTPVRAVTAAQRDILLFGHVCAGQVLTVNFTAPSGPFCANGVKIGSVTAIPGFTFARSSPESCTDLTGNITYVLNDTPCITNAGYQSWTSGTNLALASGDFTNATYWAGGNATVTTGVVAPDGTTSAVTFNEGVATGVHNLNPTAAGFISVTATQSYVASVYAKVGTGNFLQIVYTNSQFATTKYANFDISLCTVTATGGGLVASGATLYPNGWCRIWTVATANTTGANGSLFVVSIPANNSARNASYTGTSLTRFLWGAQFENSTFITPYIPTSTTTATRLADTLKITGLGATLAGSFTFSVRAVLPVMDGTSRVIGEVSDGSASNRYDFRRSSTNTGQVVASTAGVNTNFDVISGLTGAINLNMAARVTSANYSAAANGTLGALQVYAQPAGLTEIDIGETGAGAGQVNGNITRVQLLGPVPDSTVQGLTQ